MNTNVRPITEEEARAKAEEILAFEIGNLPRLGELEVEEKEYVFPLLIRTPRVIFDEDRSQPQDVRFLSKEKVGTIQVHSETGEVSRTSLREIQKRVRAQQLELEELVEKALVRSSAERFSRLSFPDHRFTPVLDLLSRVLMDCSVPHDRLDEMKAVNKKKYLRYVDLLNEVNLLRSTDAGIEADDVLIEMERDLGDPDDVSQAALGHLYREGIHEIDRIRQILGPYLNLGTYYYFRVLESDEFPAMTKEEFEQVLERHYTGEDRSQKLFKLPRYLIQLERVGILESFSKNGERAWKGRAEVREDLYEEDEILEPYIEAFA